MPKTAIYIAAALLFLGVLPLPYGYYTLLRMVAFGVFAWAAFIAFERRGSVLPWVFVLLAILFNPIITIHFPKELWAVLDLCSGALLIFASGEIQEKKTQGT